VRPSLAGDCSIFLLQRILSLEFHGYQHGSGHTVEKAAAGAYYRVIDGQTEV
jgi:hypothetical protein